MISNPHPPLPRNTLQFYNIPAKKYIGFSFFSSPFCFSSLLSPRSSHLLGLMGRRAGEEEEEGKEGDSYFIIFPCRESERTRRIGTGFISSKGGGGEVHVFGLLIFLRGGMGNRGKRRVAA